VGELLKSMTATDMLHVPYKGDAPLSQALLAGKCSSRSCRSPASCLTSVGRLRALE